MFHLQRQTGITQIVPIHNRQCHGKVRFLHIRQINWKKILHSPLISLWDYKPRFNYRLPSSKFYCCFKQ